MTLYGISGRAGHGKDSLSKAIVKASKGTWVPFTITHFADLLKHQAMEIFGISEYDAYDAVGKETPFVQPVTMDDYLHRMQEVTGLPIQKRGKIANTPRELLQYYGTEYVRTIQDDYWICNTLDGLDGRSLVADTRFPNEGAAIHARGGKLIKVVRIDLPKSTDQHASEVLMDSIAPDMLLQVLTGDFTRHQQIAEHLARDEWKRATNLALAFAMEDHKNGYRG